MRSKRGITVNNCENIITSYPNFVSDMDQLGFRIDEVKHKIITIDGPSASGKGVLSKKLSKHLNFEILDSGLLYRAYAYLFNLNNDHDKQNQTLKK
ncbi:MAG: hypothetical protein CM15mP104_3230 [Gammaproteobacteria bacterium]|nr:MAG: hypothetical protein CM15mP104_3230 [Gammaproteobacteria bacterium]